MKGNFKFLVLLVLGQLFACKQDKPEATPVVVTDELNSNTEEWDNELYATLDRLRIRSDSSLNSKTVITVTEGDTLHYLSESSTQFLALQLRSKYEFAPWLKVKHLKSGKLGWVYGGAVNFFKDSFGQQILEGHPAWEQINADDLEWNGNVPSSWNQASITNPKDFKIFVVAFKELLLKRDIQKLASFLEYPIKELNSKADFVNNFERVFSEDFIAQVLDQRLDRIYRTRKGAELANGKLLFRQIKGKYKLVDIDFKSRNDMIQDYMNLFEGSYYHQDLNGEINVLAIKDRLELSYLEKNDRTKSPKSLGAYQFSNLKSGRYLFSMTEPVGLRASSVFSFDQDSVRSLTLDHPQFSKLSELIFRHQ